MLRLAALRKEKQMSQRAVAEALGTAQQNIDNYEKGKFEPDIQMLSAMADFFEVSVDYLIGKANRRTPADQMKVYELDSLEERLVNCYRALPDDVKTHYDALVVYYQTTDPGKTDL